MLAWDDNRNQTFNAIFARGPCDESFVALEYRACEAGTAEIASLARKTSSDEHNAYIFLDYRLDLSCACSRCPLQKQCFMECC